VPDPRLATSGAPGFWRWERRAARTSGWKVAGKLSARAIAGWPTAGCPR
jgi:hypothetical protein